MQTSENKKQINDQQKNNIIENKIPPPSAPFAIPIARAPKPYSAQEQALKLQKKKKEKPEIGTLAGDKDFIVTGVNMDTSCAHHEDVE